MISSIVIHQERTTVEETLQANGTGIVIENLISEPSLDRSLTTESESYSPSLFVDRFALNRYGSTMILGGNLSE
jgi:hypothetical protein